MKRHESLIPVSRQHHAGLLTARLLQKDAPPYKGMPVTPAEKREYVLQFLEEHLKPHFLLEEQTVFRVAETVSEALKAQAAVLTGQHRQLEQLIPALRPVPEEALPEHLHVIGILLEQHIRTEERVFFEALQQELPEAELQRLKEQVAQHLEL